MVLGTHCVLADDCKSYKMMGNHQLEVVITLLMARKKSCFQNNLDNHLGPVLPPSTASSPFQNHLNELSKSNFLMSHLTLWNSFPAKRLLQSIIGCLLLALSFTFMNAYELLLWKCSFVSYWWPKIKSSKIVFSGWLKAFHHREDVHKELILKLDQFFNL